MRLLFTGDLVNNRADEMLRWKDSFTKLNARDGHVFSILGNHDYGDYVTLGIGGSKEIKIFKDLDQYSKRNWL